jgi:hypothetical protein
VAVLAVLVFTASMVKALLVSADATSALVPTVCLDLQSEKSWVLSEALLMGSKLVGYLILTAE